MNHINAFAVRATVLRISSKNAAPLFQIRRYHFGDVTKAISELDTFDSEIEAQRAFYKAFPNGALAEETRYGVMYMPSREIARHCTRLRKGWSVQDNGKEAGTMRWACVKTGAVSEPKQSQSVAEFLAA